jgi:hypothetical protein
MPAPAPRPTLPVTRGPPSPDRYAGYASDVTRTWPVTGSFTGPQRDVYEAVLEARRAVLDAVRPGTTLSRLHTLSVGLISEALRQLRVLPGLSAEAIQAQHYRWAATARRRVPRARVLLHAGTACTCAPPRIGLWRIAWMLGSARRYAAVERGRPTRVAPTPDHQLRTPPFCPRRNARAARPKPPVPPQTCPQGVLLPLHRPLPRARRPRHRLGRRARAARGGRGDGHRAGHLHPRPPAVRRVPRRAALRRPGRGARRRGFLACSRRAAWRRRHRHVPGR